VAISETTTGFERKSRIEAADINPSKAKQQDTILPLSMHINSKYSRAWKPSPPLET
jgi:hypothetical protein